MSAKSAYEIRANLLELAHKIVQEKHRVANINNENKSNQSCPTTEEVIEEATRLNTFVSATSGRN